MHRGFSEADDSIIEAVGPARLLFGLGPTLRCVVAIPVKDEEERLPACLAAFAAQIDTSGRPFDPEAFGIVVYANNCRDSSARLARELAERFSLRLRVVEVTLAPGEAHAGAARRGAMDAAEEWLAASGAFDGVILTTDADSRVSPLWIANNLAAIAAGADAVLGNLRLDEEGDRLPEALHRRGRLEGAYEALLAETSALIDPVGHDPWPHHSTIAGASIAIRREAYLRAGRLPRVPVGEDKALVAALSLIDARIRHCLDVLVTTSGRCEGRAPGGVADTLRLRSADPSALCDEALEPYRVAFTRARARRGLRLWRRSGDPAALHSWARRLQVSEDCADRAASCPTFGAAWREIESHSPVLVRRPLAPIELPREIALARRAVDRLRRIASAPNEQIEAEFAMPVAALETCE